MHSRKNIFILTLLLVCSIISQAQVQTDTTQNKTKFFDKIGHWVTAYMLGGPDFMQTQRNDFKSSAFAELYIEGSIVKDVWMFNMLNRITEMRHEQKQTPHILIKILLKPENEALSLYSVNLNVTASQNLPINLATIASQAVSKHLNKTPYSEPAYAVDDIEKALEEIFQNLKTALGNSLAPNLLLRYNNEIYWSGHEIIVLANEGNSVEIEAIDKNLQPIPSAQLSWTNASPFTHKGVVDLTNLSSQQVSVRRQQQGSQPDNATVTLKRVNVTEDINDLLKALIIEVLSAKKEEVQDTLNTLLQNRTENAEKIRQYIANLERYNFPMEGPASGSLMFPTPLYRADSAALMNTDNEQTRNIATSILALKKQKAVKRKIKIKANVAAFADLVVDNPERLEDLLDELLRNSGSLIAQLILNRDNSGTRQTARNIVVDFINRNIERIAGSAAMATPAEAEPTIEIPVLPSAAPAFNPARRLYLSASLPANTRQELESALSDYLNNLEQPLYVFVNYSHDANTENYLSRAIGNKPVGIPEGARYKVYTIINIPGSIMENVVGEAGEVTATTTKGGIVEGVMRQEQGFLHTYCTPNPNLAFKWATPVQGIRTFLTPSGKPIRFSPSDILTNLTFGGFTCEGATSSKIPPSSQQTLSGFTLNNINYVGVIDIPWFGENTFLGYALIPANSSFDDENVDNYTYYNQGTTNWGESVTVRIPVNTVSFEDCNISTSDLDFDNGSLMQTLPCPNLSIDFIRREELNRILEQNLAELAKPILVRVMEPKSWALENRSFYLDPREQEKNESLLQTTSGGALYFEADDDGYINLNEIFANNHRASLDKVISVAITLEEFLISVTTLWAIYNNAGEYSNIKINGKPKSQILLNESKEGEISNVQLISEVISLRKTLVHKLSLQKLTPEELRLTINLLFNVNESLKYTFGEKSLYPFTLIQDLQKVKVSPLESYKLTPARSDQDLLNQLKYIYTNDPTSLTKEEIELYLHLLCQLEGDCAALDVIDLNTINKHLKGTYHPVTGVRFVEKIIEINGLKYKGVFPKFEYLARVQLPQDMYEASDITQFSEATKFLRYRIQQDPSLKSRFTDEQLNDIAIGRGKIRDLVWHHSEDVGILELVDEIIHGDTGHTGGRSIWGGGSDKR
jgi:hypothetical protein